ncbi:unnamed protein product, partial [Prorocentrum cordatum]
SLKWTSPFSSRRGLGGVCLAPLGETDAADMRRFCFDVLLVPPNGAVEEVAARGLARALAPEGGDAVTVDVLPDLAAACACARSEDLCAMLQRVYSQRCVLGEESCLLLCPAAAWGALDALGSWFLGRTPRAAPGAAAPWDGFPCEGVAR